MPVPGGPIVPVTTVKSPDTVPVEPVVTRSFEGLVQPTGTLLPNTLMVGSPGAALHSRIPPVELSWKPLPDTASTMLALRQVAGSTLSVAPLVVTDPTDGVQLVGAVVVVVEDGEVVDDVELVVVELGEVVDVVVELGEVVEVVVVLVVVVVVDWDAKLIGTITLSPLRSP